MRLLSVACALGLAACASGGNGASPGSRNEPVRALLSADVMMFVSFDADGDLSVSGAETDAGTEREFGRADTNRDGQIQPLEFQSWANTVLGGGQIGPYRLDFDRNVDNTISRDEFVTEIRARVRDYDSNEDGALSRTEFVRVLGQTRPAPSVPPAGAGRPDGPARTPN